MNNYFEYLEEEVTVIDESFWVSPEEIREQYEYPIDGKCPKCGRELIDWSEEKCHCYNCSTTLFNEINLPEWVR